MSMPQTSDVPPAPGTILEAARAWLEPVRRALGGEFIACYLTGSVLHQGFDPARSGVNLLILVRALDMDVLDRVAAAMPAPARDKPRMDPLLLSERQMRTSLDAFSIEWTEIVEMHLLLDGEDVLATLVVPRENLRLQCENELRTKLLTLRQAYLQARGDATGLETVLKSAASSFATLFRTLLRLGGETPASGTPQVMDRVAEVYHLDARTLLEAWQVRFEPRRLKPDEVRALYRRFVIQIERLVDVIDSLRVP
jgi:hypothetical protein